MPRRAFAALALAIACGPMLPVGTHAQTPAIERRKAADTRDYTDSEIRDGFLRIALGAEFAAAGRTDRIRKYVEPVRVRVEFRGGLDRRTAATSVIADIARLVPKLDIALAEPDQPANIRLLLVRNAQLPRTIAELYGRERARQIERQLAPQCLSAFRKDDQFRIVESQVIVASDVSTDVFYDCLYEELLQALGPINDTAAIRWTMFNDDVQMGYFDRYDRHILNILYHPAIRPGMDAAAVDALLPQILPEVRSLIGLPPARRR